MSSASTPKPRVGGTTAVVLSSRALNRATLDRQLLLRRHQLSALAAVERLVGLQAQAPFPPYFGLWSRLDDFKPDQLAELLLDRSVVRMVLMRATVHLVSAQDALSLRPLMQPIMDRDLRNNTQHGDAISRMDMRLLAEKARELTEEQPRNSTELGVALQETWPEHDASAMVHAVRDLLPLVQTPPRAVWGKSGQVRYVPLESWTDSKLDSNPSIDSVLLRYFAAFGPATIGDAQTWSGLTGLREVVDGLRDQLRIFRDEHGRELFDLPDASRPTEDTPAPTRFLAPFDNLLLSHSDRTRVISDQHRKVVTGQNGVVKPTILVDGFVRGVWDISRKADTATLSIQPFSKLSKKDASALEEEGQLLLEFAESNAETHNIVFAKP